MIRAMKNDSETGWRIMDEAAGVVGPAVPVARKPNTSYGMADFHRIMIAACVLGVSAFGYASAVRRIVTGRLGLPCRHRVLPCGEWIRNVVAGTDASLLACSFAEKISGQIGTMRRLGMIPGKMDVALDMHLIPRWDAKKTADLVRSKMKNGTTWFERYVTVQIVNAGSQIRVAAEHMPSLESTADFVDRMTSLCRRSGADIRNVLLDREFFSGDVIRTLDAAGVGYLMPCTNTSGVVAAIREFTDGKRPAVLTHAIIKSHGERIPYTMIIAVRRKRLRKSKPSRTAPEDAYIAFATNRPGMDVERYAR